MYEESKWAFIKITTAASYFVQDSNNETGQKEVNLMLL